MESKLIKELRDAGFPMKKKDGCVNCWGDLHQGCDADCGEELPIELSDLIQECGLRITALKRSPNLRMWLCSSFDKNGEHFDTDFFTTPEEAVAKLWLSLNKK